jgi:type IV pilus assembly protein PilA
VTVYCYWLCGDYFLCPYFLSFAGISFVLRVAYQDYMIRAKVSEVILAASGARTAITEKAQQDNAITYSGCGLSISPVGKISAATVGDNGIIQVAGTTATTSVGAAITITLSPTFTGGTVTWTCQASNPKYAPSSCR